MVDRAVSRFGPFFEKLMLWALEGEESPFDRHDFKRLESARKPVRKKRRKNKALTGLAHTAIHQKT